MAQIKMMKNKIKMFFLYHLYLCNLWMIYVLMEWMDWGPDRDRSHPRHPRIDWFPLSALRSPWSIARRAYPWIALVLPKAISKSLTAGISIAKSANPYAPTLQRNAARISRLMRLMMQ